MVDSNRDEKTQAALDLLRNNPADHFLKVGVDFQDGKKTTFWALDFSRVSAEMLTDRECLKELERVLECARERNRHEVVDSLSGPQYAMYRDPDD